MNRNLKKRSDGRCCKTVTDPVSGKRIFFYGKNEKEINKKILEYKSNTDKGKTFKDVADDWWEEAEPNLEYQSVKSYKPALNRAIDFFGNDYIKSILPKDIKSFLNGLVAKEFAFKTIANNRLVCNLIFEYAVIHNDISTNPCYSVKTPKSVNKTVRTAASSSDEQIIKNSASVWLFPFIAIFTGMRKCEILALQWKDIDFDNNIINVTKSVYHKGDKPFIKKPKTLASVRIVPLLAPLKDALNNVNDKSLNDYIISDFGTTPLTNRRFITLYNHFRKETGISCTAHQLRHSFATIAFECGVPVKSIQNILGHKQLSTTMDIYTDFRKKSLDEAADLLNSKFKF